MTDRVSKHFTVAEMRCRGSGLLRFHPEFLGYLEHLRIAYGRPMNVTSGCRSTAHNRAVGGSPNSYHRGDATWPNGSIGALAVDVRTVPGGNTPELVRLALSMRWSVGISTRGFTHFDARFLLGHPQVVFGY